jgi:hypothetical protein
MNTKIQKTKLFLIIIKKNKAFLYTKIKKYQKQQ